MMLLQALLGAVVIGAAAVAGVYRFDEWRADRHQLPAVVTNHDCGGDGFSVHGVSPKCRTYEYVPCRSTSL